jgi:hypothetical protein
MDRSLPGTETGPAVGRQCRDWIQEAWSEARSLSVDPGVTNQSAS